jgi:putative toxin-antitoxin system antitoxin component (TIGR02293 family)
LKERRRLDEATNASHSEVSIRRECARWKGVAGATPRSSLDWVGMIREGIPAGAVESVLSAVHVSQSELAQALAVRQRTRPRWKREGVLNSEESSKLLRLARVMSRASEVFDGPAAAIDWLKSPNAALRGNAPLHLLDTDRAFGGSCLGNNSGVFSPARGALPTASPNAPSAVGESSELGTEYHGGHGRRPSPIPVIRTCT